MEYLPVTLRRPLVVEQVVTVHYFEYTSHYYFEGERHDFWEFLYVDKGTVTVAAEGRETALCRGQMVFHQPGEFHALRADGQAAPNLVVVSFVCKSPEMEMFRGRTLTVGDGERALLAAMIREAEAAFMTPLGDPTTRTLERRTDAPFGAEQMLGAALEKLLICLIRDTSHRAGPTSLPRENAQQELIERVEAYMEARLDQKLTLEDLCRVHLVGRSYLQRAFHKQTGGGVMERFAALRLEAAKRMVREGGGNFSQIAIALGYGSIGYFSRAFKKAAGMTPSEYAASVKSIAAKTKMAE